MLKREKTVTNPVGVAPLGDPHIEGTTKKENTKGITLIALIITIIVMLILVGVSVTVALNGGLFKTAKQATEKTETERDKEQKLTSGRVKIGGVWYDSMDDYVKGKPSENQSEGTTEVEESTEWAETTKPTEWENNDKVTAMTNETYTIPLPEEFEISEVVEERTVVGGLVIKDSNNNEFVWVPVTDAASYAEDNLGPLTEADYVNNTYVADSQENLNYYYGTNDDGTPYYNYLDFTYEEDKTKIEENIQTYGGFYVGRYETTIEGSTIGVQRGKTVLTAGTSLKEGTNATSNDEYYYRWWGLYKAQKDMYENNSSVGSLMISSKQWDEIMAFTGYGDTTRPTDTYTTKPDLSGSAYATDSSAYDVSKNIHDLAGNVYEWTLKPYHTSYSRIVRGRLLP